VGWLSRLLDWIGDRILSDEPFDIWDDEEVTLP
jgi:hypothetical protein